ncbi:autotransporter outer membrane beta-barrel domain-containing protein [Bartonella sp. B1099]|nr:autotransporter outer membrane beta-barrel domain-containing protein [Bartonella sp. B1099]
MYKKSLLSSIATAAIVLFNIQFNVHAESLEVSGEKKEIKDATYETLHALKDGQIIGTDLKITGNKDTNSSSNTNIYVISTEGKGSSIELKGDNTTIKGTDSDIRLGLEVKDDAILQVTGGTITVSDTGVHFLNSNSKENKLENVTISSGKDDAPLHAGIKTENSTITLENVKVTQTNNAVVANNNSTITISGGSFETQKLTLGALNGSTITLNTNVQITSENSGLYAKNGSAISMTGGIIKASEIGASFESSKSDNNKLNGVTISSNKEDALLKKGVSADNSTVALTNVTVSQAVNAVVADNESTITISGGSFETQKVTLGALNGSTIILNNNVQITSENTGLYAKDGGAISMTGGTIKTSEVGAGFEGSNNEKNKLENVTILSNKDGALLNVGVSADKNSTVALKNVTVKQVESAVVADNESTITVSGGSFDAKEATIYAGKGSTVILTDVTQITSSENDGLLAETGGAINMTGGTIKAFYNGADFEGSNSEKNKLENVTILSNKDGALLNAGVSADKSTVALTNVTVTQAENAVVADNESTITVSGGSFDAKLATIASQGNSIVTLTNNAQITSSENTSLLAKEGGAISMTGGTIKASNVGATFENSKREENKLENVTISSSKDDARLKAGVSADQSTVALTNVTVSQAENAVVADNKSTITISGGSFDAKLATIASQGNSIVTLTNNAQITSSENDGLLAQNDGAISMTGGIIKASNVGAHFENSKREENKLENVTISSSKDDALLLNGILAVQNSTVALTNVTVTKANSAIIADDQSTITVSGGEFDAKKVTIGSQGNSIITLTDNAQITSSENDGLLAQNDGAISMTGGSIKAFYNGATFENSKREENKLENVTISSVKDDARLKAGISADQSTVALKNVTVTKAENAVVADNKSTITVSGGSFDAKYATIATQNSGTIILTDNAQITSSEDTGLYVKDGGAINMTGGSIKAFYNGASFENSKREENKLENVTISSVKDGDDALLHYGIKANKSTIILNNVTVTKAESAIIADDHSTITVSGGSFESEGDGIYAKQGSSIALNNATVTSSYGDSVYADGPDSKIIMVGGSATAKSNSAALLTENQGQIDATDVTLTTNGIGTGALALGESTIQLHGNTTINNTLDGLRTADGGKITGENLNITGGKAINSDPDTERSGLTTEGAGSEINLTGKTIIQNVDEGFYADGGSKITSGDLVMTAGESEKITTAVGSYEPESKIELNGNTTIKSFDLGLAAAGDASIIMKNGTKNEIDVKKVALSAAARGKIDLANTDVKAESIGMQLVALSKTNTDKLDDLQIDGNSEINLTNSNIHVDNGTGILVGAFAAKSIENSPALSIGTINLNNSKIHADMLLDDGIFWDKISGNDKNFWNDETMKKISNGSFTLNADHSTLEGRANIAQERNVHFNLKNGTQWFLKNSTQEKNAEGNLLDIAQRSRSDISVLDLNDSSLIFQEPTENHYHTLHIGSGKPDTESVYNATGDAKIYFNTKWTDGTPITEQETDHLLIHGDVSGSTTVYIQSDLGDKESVINASDPSNIGGLSLIQVSGKADENSFKLAHGYITKGGAPYKYTLTGYGPESSYGQANIEQSLFDEKNENFWDFRLHKEFLPDSKVEAPVAQMASYLVMPNALFYSGLTDMAEQNALLANIRTAVIDKGQEKQNGFFLHTYGSTGTFSSESAPRQYGYSGADLRYAALQGGVNFATLEGHNTTTRFGLLGTYGQLSFTPKNMRDAGKNTVDKWSLTAYGTIQYDNGFYLDTLLSYGFLKGEITNALIGTTAKLKNAKMLNISTTVGKQFATGIQGVTFEPQAQLAYQHLTFDTIADADNFTVDMQNPHQWMIRIGGRLTKSISTENNRPMSFYGKVNLIKTFRDDQSLHIDKDYKLDAMGSALEGGLGINAQLSTNLSLHGDVSYQQKLQKTGISGASFSGGIRYQF